MISAWIAAVWAAVLSAGLVLHVAEPGGAGDLPWSLGAVVTLAAGAAIVWAVFCVVTMVVRFAARGRLTIEWSSAVSTGVVGALLLVNGTYRELFSGHLGWHALVEAWEAFSTGILTPSWSGVAWAVLGLGAYIGVTGVLLGVGTRIVERSSWTPPSGVLVPLSLALLCLVGLRTCAVSGHDARARHILQRLPWERAGDVGALRASTAARTGGPAAGGPIMDEADERQQFAGLVARRSGLLKDARADRTPHILIVMIESLRADTANDEVMPQLSRFTEQWLGRTVHLTTGANTGTSNFGVLTGLDGFYYPWQRRTRPGVLPLQLLGGLGYRRTLYVTVNPAYDDHHKVLYSDMDELVQTPTHGKGQAEATRKSIDRVFADIAKTPADVPRLDMMILNATHYTYMYPPEMERFTPVAKQDFSIASGAQSRLSEHAVMIKNRFLNSAWFTDHELGRIVARLEELGRLDNTILVIAGDHGEEFWEKGHFGHTHRLNAEQVHTAFAMRLPGLPKTRYGYTSHADIFPTIFDHMGLSAPSERFMTGKSLLEYDPARDYTIAGQGVVGSRRTYNFVLAAQDRKLHFRNYGPLVPTAVTDLDDAPIADPDPDRVARMLRMIEGAKSLPRGTPAKLTSESYDRRLQAALQVRTKEELVALGARQSKVISDLLKLGPKAWNPATARRGIVSDRDLRASVWQLNCAGKKGPLELMGDGDVGWGRTRPRHRWSEVGGNLVLSDADGVHGEVFLSDEASGRLVGRSVAGKACVMTRRKDLGAAALPKRLWGADARPGALTEEVLLAQPWRMRLWSKGMKRSKRSDLVQFVPGGAVGEGSTAEFARWEIHGGRLYVLSADGGSRHRYHFDADGQRLVAGGPGRRPSLLSPWLRRSVDSIPDALWASDATDTPADEASVTAAPWRTHVARPGGDLGNPGVVELAPGGGVEIGRRYAWSSWKVVSGRLTMLDGEGREAAWFRHDAEKRRFVGVTATGELHVLDSMAPQPERWAPAARVAADPPALGRAEVVEPVAWRCASAGDAPKPFSLRLRSDGRVAKGNRFEKWTLVGGRLYVVDRRRKEPLAFVRGGAPGGLVGAAFDDDALHGSGAFGLGGSKAAVYRCSSAP